MQGRSVCDFRSLTSKSEENRRRRSLCRLLDAIVSWTALPLGSPVGVAQAMSRVPVDAGTVQSVPPPLEGVAGLTPPPLLFWIQPDASGIGLVKERVGLSVRRALKS